MVNSRQIPLFLLLGWLAWLGWGMCAGRAQPAAFEPLGQCSRNTSLVISEILYHPAKTHGTINTNSAGLVTNSLEFIELYNASATPEDLSGYRLSGSIDYTFPANTTISAGGFLVVAKSPADVQNVYGLPNVLGPYEHSLPNSSGLIQLRHPSGAVFLEVNYDDNPPWPVAADGSGHSLILARPSLGEGNPAAWAASDTVGGSPGGPEPIPIDPLRAVVVNELLAYPDLAALGFVELYNPSAQPLDISGCFLSDDPATNVFVLPPQTIVPAGGFVVFGQSDLGFTLNPGGGTIYFRNPANTRVLDVCRYEGQALGVSLGRFPDGAGDWRALTAKTPGRRNASPLSRDLVINEIMFDPISGDDDDQFVELYNKGSSALNLGGWKFIAGLNFTFPTNTILNPDGYLVVGRNAARLSTHYGNLNSGNLVGDFTGKLSHDGERLAVAMPDVVVSADGGGGLSTNLIYVVVNEVTYHRGWGRWSSHGGSSLELIDPRSDNRLAANWADSDESGKAPWTSVSTTGVLDNGFVPAGELYVLLQGAGECLLDNVQVLNSLNVNLVTNATFEAGAEGWVAEGTEKTSSLEPTGGVISGSAYHLRAVDRGDNQINRLRTTLSSIPAPGSTATIRAQVRWLRGFPQVLFRIQGNWLEAVGTMTLPPNLGTPGARNSRFLTNAPPAIYGVAHSPVLPGNAQPVVVTARAHDSDGVAAMWLNYRLDPSPDYTQVPMLDDGTGGDAVAGDGLYSATIPGQAAGTLAAFYVQALDGTLSPASARFPADAPARECLVRFGESQPQGAFPVYRLWMTQGTLTNWNNHSHLDNSPNDITFVLGNQRVVYNAQAHFDGSPYIAPSYCGATCGRCGYSLTFPQDDLFLGSTDLVIDWPGGHNDTNAPTLGEHSALQEEMGYWIANKLGLPFCHRYIIRLHVNGITDDQRQAVFEAVNKPGSDFVNAWSPDAHAGDLYKVDRAFELTDAGGVDTAPMARLDVYTTTGGAKKESRYRWSWNKRAGDSPNNHTNIYNLVDAVNAPGPQPFTALTDALIDSEEWMSVFAAEHIIANFDSYGHEIGKNLYAYKPDGGKWQLYMFDLDWLMLSAPLHSPNYAPGTAPLFNADDPNIARLYNAPPFRRAYFRAVQDAVDGPLWSANCEPIIDAKYAALVANGVQFCDGSPLVEPSNVKAWFSQRRAFLLSQLASVATPFTVTADVVNASSNLVTLGGTAPIPVKSIEVNGVPWPVTWTTISNWTMCVPVSQATNQLILTGFDKRGNPLPAASNEVTVLYGGPAPSPRGWVVFNEIMANPRLPGAEYVELLNISTNMAMDLSSWRIPELDYTFPPGTALPAGGLLLIAKSRDAALAAYGSTLVIFDEFSGALQPGGQTLTLIQPGVPPDRDVIINEVRYESAPPWPANPAGAGFSLQLIDASQDNTRVSNWGDGSNWRLASLTGSIGSSSNFIGTNLLIYLQGPGEVYLDDISLVPLAGPLTGSNVVRNGGFEAPLDGTWTVPASLGGSGVTRADAHSGSYSLHVVATSGGTIANSIQQALPTLSPNTPCTLSFWYRPTPGPNSVVRTYLGSALILNVDPRPILGTPGLSNSVASVLPAYPPIWINEVQPENLGGTTNNTGQTAPWLELYNGGDMSVPLDGYYLSTNYDDLSLWSFPPGSVLFPGEFKVVFADGAPLQSAPWELHTSFRLSPETGSLALTRQVNGSLQVVDYINYRDLVAGRSYGSYPDGQGITRQEFYRGTPGAANLAAAPPPVVSINEWMASNTRTLVNPATGNYDDWFELYNPGPAPVNLAGCYLTDTLANQSQFLIPAGYSVQPRGYLLVWADNQPYQNNSNRLELHVNFQLNKGGEAIGLFAPDGTQIDTVIFGPQQSDISMGRCPDGTANLLLMPAPTPQAANTCPLPKPAPRLLPIGTQYVHQGETLTFAALATDAALPPPPLSFSLDAGAPFGAFIDGGSGWFTWPGAFLPGPGTNLLLVRVTDLDTPALQDSQLVTVVVLGPLGFSQVTRQGDQLVLGWATAPGRTYRVEYTDELGGTAWVPVGPDFPALGMSLSVSVTVTDAPQRFYRVRLVE